MGKKMLIIVFILLMCMTGLVNAFAAEDKENPPVINTKLEVSETTTLKLTVKYPEITGLENSAVQNDLNALFAKLAAEAASRGHEIEKYIGQDHIARQVKAEIYFDYQVKYNRKGLLSVVFSDYQYSGGAHGITVQSSYTFDLKTGKEYKIKDVFKDGSDYVSLISNEVKKQMEEREMTFLLAPFNSIKTDQDFYLSEKAVVVYFQAYEYLPYAFGIPEFAVDFSDLALLLSEDVWSTLENKPYAFEIGQNTDKAMRVDFVGNQMFHNDRYLGFGVSGRPMLSLRYIAQEFGFQVDYNSQSKAYYVSKDGYSFRLKPGSRLAEIYWEGEKIKEAELTAKPLLRNNVLYLYSLDISDLLGLSTTWDNSARVWDVVYREYTYRELGFSTKVKGDLLKLKGLLIDAGTSNMPMLKITDKTTKARSYSSSSSLLDPGADSLHKYELKTEIQLKEKISFLQIKLTLGHRIIFAKNIEVAMDIEAKELLVDPPYQINSPTKGYVKLSQPLLLIDGSVSGINNYYPAEVVLFVRKANNDELLLQESVPIIEGQFQHELKFNYGEGLYKVTVNSIMAAPHGTAYPEITNFYVEYQ